MEVRDVSLDEYFGNNELSKSVFKAKYFLENDKSVTDVFKRVAEGLAQYEENSTEWAERWTQEMLDGWYRPGGSILSGVGNSAKVSLANCTTIGLPEDTIDSISNTQREMMKCAAARQGLGVDVSNIRPRGAKVNNAAKVSGGVVPWMDYLQGIANYVGQQGRMPAVLLSIKVDHPDVEEFIKCKIDTNKITNANISVQISNDFMEAVKADKDWTLSFTTPHEKIEKVVKAKELMHLIAKLACKSAEPGVQFIDNMREGSLVHQIYKETGDERFKIISTNACLCKNNTVLTPDGISTIGEINEGDTIWTGENWTKVTKKWFTGIKPTFKYSTNIGELYCTSDHKVVLKNGERVEIGNSKHVLPAMGCRNRSRYDNWDTQAVVDGIIVATARVRSHVCIVSQRQGTDIFEWDEIKDYITFKSKVHLAYDRTLVHLKSTIPFEEIGPLGDRRIPEKYYRCKDERIIASFLRGYLSVRSTFAKQSGNRLYLVLKGFSEEILRQIQEMLAFLGINTWVKRLYFRHRIEPGDMFGLWVTRDFHIFADKIGFIQDYKLKLLYGALSLTYSGEIRSPFFAKRKKKGGYFSHNGMNTLRTIKTVEDNGDQEVYDITVEDESHQFWCGGIKTSNCSEKPLANGSTCVLASLNMNKFATDKDTYIQQLQDVVPSLVRLIDNAVEYEIQNNLAPIETQKWIIKQLREIGLGITNVHAWLLKQGLPYDSNEAIDAFEEFFANYMGIAYKASMDLAEEKGPAEVYKTYPIAMPLPYVLGGSSAYNNICNRFFPELHDQRPLRNLAIGSIAPTGTLSMTFSEPTLSSGIEPAIGAYYWRKTRALSGSSNEYRWFFVLPEAVKKYIIEHEDFKNLSIQDQQYICNLPESQEDSDGTIGKNVISIIGKFLDKVNFKPAHEIDPFQKIKMMSRIYKWLDSACSVTYNLPKGTTPETIEQIYMQAWELGVRAVSVYVDGSREGILVFEPPVQEEEKPKNIFCEERPKEITFTCAPKRGKRMPCEIHRCKVKGKDWLILVGLMNGYPYEIFAGEYNKDEMYVPSSLNEGIIIKNGKGAYSLLINIKGAEVEYKDIARTFMNERYRSMTRMISLALRHGVRPVYIIDQIKKADEDITEFSSVVTRILNKYIKALDYTYLSKSTGFKCEFCGSENAIFNGGCKICAQCGKGSKCD